MTFYMADSYRDLMASALTGQANRGQLTRAAVFLNCQRSYLSRVVLGEMHLTPDHAFGLTEFLRYSPEQQSFFLLLVDWERAGNPSHRRYLETKIQDIRKRSQSVAHQTERIHLKPAPVDTLYFSSWTWSAIHFLTSIPALQTIEALAGRLNLAVSIVRHCLDELERRGMVARQGKGWVYKSGEFHLPKGSPLLALHQQNWRARALIDSQDPESNGVHFTGVQTVSRADAHLIREKLLEFIRTASQIAAPSDPQEAVVLTLDYFSL